MIKYYIYKVTEKEKKEVKVMKLVKVESKRTNKQGSPYLDLFLVWEHENKVYKVRVAPTFSRDYKLLAAEAVSAPNYNASEQVA